MYKFPIELICGELYTQLEREGENMVLNAIRKMGVNIDKEELLKALQYDRKQYKKGYEDAKSDLQKQTKWIPVSENLPEEGVNVLVCDNYGDIKITNGKYITFEKETWCWDIDDFAFGKVVAWKPLPKPYEPYNYYDGSALLEILNRLREVTEGEE